MSAMDYLLFEDYIRDNLNYQDKRLLEQRLLVEQDSHQNFICYEKVRSHMVEYMKSNKREEELRIHLDKLGNKYFLDAKVSIITSRFWRSIVSFFRNK